ncbi:MAG: helix-turn-helix domain-containing protein [Chloroflexota bacterium]|nr:helix-turn-helix domain-containing protein [Chloroflexota bacterium]
MPLTFDHRPAESPFIERVWHTQSGSSGEFTSIALNHWQMCIWTHQERTYVTVRGVETKPTRAYCPPDATFFGITFRMSAALPSLMPSILVDNAVHLPANGQRFWLGGMSWEVPTYNNIDVFIDRLARTETLLRDPVIDAALHGRSSDRTLRSVQRRFVSVAGVSHTTLYQIERARHATLLLRQGASILDTVDEVGYADQSHLTRALRRWIGQTPTQIQREAASASLSFLFKTVRPD